MLEKFRETNIFCAPVKAGQYKDKYQKKHLGSKEGYFIILQFYNHRFRARHKIRKSRQQQTARGAYHKRIHKTELCDYKASDNHTDTHKNEIHKLILAGMQWRFFFADFKEHGFLRDRNKPGAEISQKGENRKDQKRFGNNKAYSAQ